MSNCKYELDYEKMLNGKYYKSNYSNKIKTINYQNIKHNGYVGVYCPNCYTPYKFKISAKAIVKCDHVDIRPVINLEDLLKLNLSCDTCNESSIVTVLDANIVDSIAVLNRKGYETKYSCEGNMVSDNMMCTAYIAFEPDCFPINIVDNYPLPEDWTLTGVTVDDNNEDLIGIYCYKPEDMSMEEYCSSEMVVDRMKNIYEWVIELPTLEKYLEMFTRK